MADIQNSQRAAQVDAGVEAADGALESKGKAQDSREVASVQPATSTSSLSTYPVDDKLAGEDQGRRTAESTPSPGVTPAREAPPSTSRTALAQIEDTQLSRTSSITSHEDGSQDSANVTGLTRVLSPLGRLSTKPSLTSDPSATASPISASASIASLQGANPPNPAQPVRVNPPANMHLPSGASTRSQPRASDSGSSLRSRGASTPAAPEPGAFAFSTLLADLLADPAAQADLDAIATICGRSRLSRADEYTAHRDPVGAVHVAGDDGPSEGTSEADGDGSLHPGLVAMYPSTHTHSHSYSHSHSHSYSHSHSHSHSLSQSHLEPLVEVASDTGSSIMRSPGGSSGWPLSVAAGQPASQWSVRNVFEGSGGSSGVGGATVPTAATSYGIAEASAASTHAGPSQGQGDLLGGERADGGAVGRLMRLASRG